MELDDISLKTIQETYEQALIIPNTKPTRPYVVCPVGLVGSGKTTVMKPLSKKLGLVRISGDEVRKILSEKGFNWQRVYEINSHLIQKYLSLGYAVGIDSDCSTHVEALKKMGNEAGAQIFWLHINPPEEFILKKLEHYNHTWLFANAVIAIGNYAMNKKRNEYNPVRVPYRYEFDTSKNNLEEQLDEAATSIREALMVP